MREITKPTLRFLFAGIILLNVPGNVKAQTDDHLEPVESIFGYGFDYDAPIRKVLFEGLFVAPLVQFIVLPPFGGESALVIEPDTSNLINGYIQGYNLVYHKAKGRARNKNVEVDKYKRQISIKSGKLIKSLFDSAISQTHYEYAMARVRLDGVSYYFVSGLQAGKTWSPSEGTKMARLVDICYELTAMVKNKTNEPIEFDPSFINMIETLAKEFRISTDYQK